MIRFRRGLKPVIRKKPNPTHQWEQIHEGMQRRSAATAQQQRDDLFLRLWFGRPGADR